MADALNTRVIQLEESLGRASAAIESLTENNKKVDRALARLWVRRRFLPASLVWGLKAAPIRLILIGAALWIWAPLHYSRARIQPAAQTPVLATQPPATPELQRQVDELTKSREAIKDRLDAISQQATHVQWRLSIVLGVAGLFTLAQGLFAFFSAQNYVKQADETVERINLLATEVRSKYPMFSEIEEQRKAAFSELESLARGLRVDENLYEKLRPLRQQKILALESFAAIQFLTSVDSPERVINCVRRLGRFYQDKFRSKKSGLHTDFDRALYYVTLAVQESNRTDISALNDLGSLMHMGGQVPEARELFEESLGVCADQQRALYDLGNTSFEEHDFEGALRYFKRAAGAKNWERLPDRDMASYVHYNLLTTTLTFLSPGTCMS